MTPSLLANSGITWNVSCGKKSEHLRWYLFFFFFVLLHFTSVAFLLANCQQWWIFGRGSGGSRISQRGTNPTGGSQPIIWPIFTENCMEMKTFWDGAPPPDPPMRGVSRNANPGGGCAEDKWLIIFFNNGLTIGGLRGCRGCAAPWPKFLRFHAVWGGCGKFGKK